MRQGEGALSFNDVIHSLVGVYEVCGLADPRGGL